jgi:hypothetical protein
VLYETATGKPPFVAAPIRALVGAMPKRFTSVENDSGAAAPFHPGSRM